ncbi:hypothetical protein BPC006_I2505 [Burkholderia pseudomallei BPC006]|nr:hypothetical protein BPC006_I2505 [Burkholderia pseudomallei BPC006]
MRLPADASHDATHRPSAGPNAGMNKTNTARHR